MNEFKQRRAVQLGTDAFVSAEVSAEETAILSANCMVTLITQRRAGRYRPEDGASALVHIGRGVAAAAEALAEFSKAHPILREFLPRADEGDGSDYGTTPTKGRQPFGDRQEYRQAEAA